MCVIVVLQVVRMGGLEGMGCVINILHQMATFEDAAEKCGQLDAHLVTIESQEESDFVNNWLFASTSK